MRRQGLRSELGLIVKIRVGSWVMGRGRVSSLGLRSR